MGQKAGWWNTEIDVNAEESAQKALRQERTKTLSEKLRHEVDVSFSFRREHTLQSEFRYKVLHVPSKRISQKTVWCFGRSEFLKLLNHWNTKVKGLWQYSE